VSRGRILVCAPTLPTPDRESGSRRLWHHVMFLRDAGYDVAILTRDATDGSGAQRTLHRRGVLVQRGFDGRLRELLVHGRFDLAIVAFWYLVDEIVPLIRSLSPRTTVLLDTIDLHFLREARQRAGRSDRDRIRFDDSFGRKMVREIDSFNRVDHVLTVSDKEAALVCDLTGCADHATAIPDAEDLAPSPVPLEERRGILFVGNFRHLPNPEALAYLCGAVLPLLDPALLRTHPLQVVGNALAADHAEIIVRVPGAQAIGWVPSVTPYIERARVTVAPLLHGAGTKRKVIESLAIGTPTVATPIAVEGLPVADGEGILVRDDAAGLAEAIVAVLTDDALWERLANAGRDRIAAVHDASVVRGRLLGLVAAMIRASGDGTGVDVRAEPVAATMSRRDGCSIVATPNPVIAWPETGATVITWTSDQPRAQVVVAIDGGECTPFASGARGRRTSPWIQPGHVYEFRLYGRAGDAEPIAATTVVGRFFDPVDGGAE
jgi:O-antigen biosynthesis protein